MITMNLLLDPPPKKKIQIWFIQKKGNKMSFLQETGTLYCSGRDETIDSDHIVASALCTILVDCPEFVALHYNSFETESSS